MPQAEPTKNFSESLPPPPPPVILICVTYMIPVKYNVKDKDCARTKMYHYSCTTTALTGFRTMTTEATCSTLLLVLVERISVPNSVLAINCFWDRFFNSFANNMAFNPEVCTIKDEVRDSRELRPKIQEKGSEMWKFTIVIHLSGFRDV